MGAIGEIQLTINEARCRKTYTLIQHTPLIHFQSEQTGATLRASEVKPKLDRFLLAFCRRKGVTPPEDWFMRDGNGALRYRMTFSGRGKGEVSEITSALYLGNMGKGRAPDQKKTFSVRHSEIRMTVDCRTRGVVSFDGNNGNTGKYSLLSLIDGVLPFFFRFTTFGARQSKGFGSFDLKDAGQSPFCDADFVPVYYQIGLEPNTDPLKLIWELQGMMKGGFNFTFKRGCENDYFKGRVFRFFTRKGIGSDKAFVKQKLLQRPFDGNPNSEDKPRYARFVYSRAMLGLSDKFEYRGSNGTRKGTVTVGAGTVDARYRHASGIERIERFRSPITFKVAEKRGAAGEPMQKAVLILPTDIPDAMFGASFAFTAYGHSQSICTPQKEEFSLIEFLDYFMAEYNGNSEILKFKGNFVTVSNRTDRHRIEKTGGEKG